MVKSGLGLREALVQLGKELFGLGVAAITPTLRLAIVEPHLDSGCVALGRGLVQSVLNEGGCVALGATLFESESRVFLPIAPDSRVVNGSGVGGRAAMVAFPDRLQVGGLCSFVEFVAGRDATWHKSQLRFAIGWAEVEGFPPQYLPLPAPLPLE